MKDEKYTPEPNTGCYIWLGAVSASSGYGNVARPRKLGTPRHYTTAHKKAYEEENGVVPDGLQVRHKCSNKLCVNPAHLIVGTQSDNERDKKHKWYL